MPPEERTGRRNENASLMHQMIGVFDEMDEENRAVFVKIGHEILASQNRRRLASEK